MSQKPPPDPLFTMRGDMAAVHGLWFDLKQDSEYLFVSTQAGIIHKWNLESCREELQHKVSEEACLSVGCLQNFYVTQMKGGEIKMWQGEENGTWKLQRSVSVNYWGFCKYSVSNFDYISLPESGNKIKFINTDGKIIRTLNCSSSEKLGEIMALKCFTLKNKNYILVLFESGALTLFNADNEDKATDCKVTVDCPMALDFDGDSNCVVGGSGDTIVGFKLTADLELVKWKETTITNPGVSCVVIRPDRKVFVAGCWDARIRLFSMKSFKLLAVLTNHKDTIHDLCYSPVRIRAFDTQWLLAAGSKDGRVSLWSLY